MTSKNGCEGDYHKADEQNIATGKFNSTSAEQITCPKKIVAQKC